VLHIPRTYNPEADGVCREVEHWKHALTRHEIRRFFSGYSSFKISGWYRDPENGKEYWDHHTRFEIDLNFPFFQKLLRIWKKMLERRFSQDSIYMKLSQSEGGL
jgi:hypothetical protein